MEVVLLQHPLQEKWKVEQHSKSSKWYLKYDVEFFIFFYHFDFGTNFDSFVSDCSGSGKYGVIFSYVG